MTKPISLKKQEIIDRWDSSDPDVQPPLVPIDTDHKGSTYAEDSFRITGSQEWIDWCLARLKPLLEFDSNGSRLQPMYVQTTTRYKNEEGKIVQGELTGSYAFYFKCQSRGSGQRARAKDSTNKNKEPKAEKATNPLREVNAGLKLKGKVEPRPTTKQPTVAAYTEPLYAIARGSMESTGRDTPDWLEPIEDHPVFSMSTYNDVIELDDAIDRAMKKHKLKRAQIQKVEITVTDKGQLIFEEF